jgi:SWI/SNF-related matrix-associated actin-dependent regulator 1 of chromatin subfamily A
MNVSLCRLPDDGTIGAEVLWYPNTLPDYCKLRNLPPNLDNFASKFDQLTLDFLLREKPDPKQIHPFDWSTIPKASMLYPYQRESIEEVVLKHNGRVILGFEQGCGKTPTASVLATHYPGRKLFVLPTNKLFDWEREHLFWTGKPLFSIRKKVDVVNPLAENVAVSFDMAKVHPGILSTKWDVIVVDEAHSLKNECIRSREIVPMLHAARAVLLLTGTPEESRPSELYNLMHALYPNYFPSRKVFSVRYCSGKENSWGKWEEGKSINLDELFLVLKEMLIRRTVASDLSHMLPPRHRYMLKMNMNNPTNIKTFKDEVSKRDELRKKEYDEKVPKEKEKIRMRRNLQSNRMWTMTETIKVPLIKDWLLKTMAEVPEDKWLIFTVHCPVLEEVNDILKEANIDHISIRGTVAPEKRPAIFKRFEESPECRAAVMTLKCGGTGLNLQYANRVLFIGTEHNPSVMAQGESRAYRPKAVKDVHCYWLYVDGTHDEALYRKLDERSLVNATIVDGVKASSLQFHIRETIEHAGLEEDVLDIMKRGEKYKAKKTGEKTTATTRKRKKNNDDVEQQDDQEEEEEEEEEKPKKKRQRRTTKKDDDANHEKKATTTRKRKTAITTTTISSTTQSNDEPPAKRVRKPRKARWLDAGDPDAEFFEELLGGS